MDLDAASSASPADCGLNPAGSLVVFWIGSNDVLPLNEDKVGDAVAIIRSNIETLIRTAGASQFLVANMPDVSLTPAYTAYDSFFIASDAVDIQPAEPESG
jgi:phospholipase/lecithinase/hemolysin